MEVAGAAAMALGASAAVGNPCIVEGLFPSPDNSNGMQLTFLTVVYGYVLFMASGFISDGSELLLLVPSLSGIVGTVVLPILGAVPDGMMVMFSCLGDDAQNQVSVGVGALAGSTIMLLTLPWFLAILGGRVDLDANGDPQYTKKPKLTPNNKFGVGVSISANTRRNAKMMVLTCFFYLIIQVPASMYSGPASEIAAFEHTWVLIGAIVCFAGLAGYLAIQVRIANQGHGDDGNLNLLNDKVLQARLEALQNGRMDIRGLMLGWIKKANSRIGLERAASRANSTFTATDGYQALNGSKVDPQLKSLLKIVFNIYDKDKSETIDFFEWSSVLRDLRLNPAEYANFFKATDRGIGLDEFCERVEAICRTDSSFAREASEAGSISLAEEKVSNSDEYSHDSEEEEIPEDLADLTPAQQQARIKLRASWMMAFGTALVLVFSDPAVDVLNEIGVRTGIPAFYVSFVLAPLASNASELVAAYNYACKKTSKTIDVSLSTLQGAACMNNTYCLFIFLVMIWIQGLVWEFTAETIAIVVVQLMMGFLVLTKSAHTMQDAYLILGIYPASLVLVWTLENVFGLD